MADAEVLAIVLNWRLADATLQLLDDLRAVDFPRLAVLLIDNGSADGSAEKLRAAAAAAAATASAASAATAATAAGAPTVTAAAEASAGTVELMAFEQNLGYCAAMNRGIARAVERGAAYGLFLNNDVRVPPDFLRPLVDVLDNDEGLAAVGPTIVDPDGRAWSHGGGVRFRPNLVTLFGQGRDPAPTDHGPEAVEFLPGACALYRLADLDAVGGLDEDYFMYWEDVDLGCRLRARGRRILWLPWVRVTHTPSGSSGGGRSPLRKYMSAVNTVRFLKRHGTARLWLAFVVFDCLLWPLTLFGFGGTGPRAALAKARGLWDGVCGHRVSTADVARYHPESTS